jgi:hypothetical protein
MSIEEGFDIRTAAKMEVALDRVCGKTPTGEQHDVRKRVAQAILACAKGGKTTLDALTEAGEKVLWRARKGCLTACDYQIRMPDAETRPSLFRRKPLCLLCRRVCLGCVQAASGGASLASGLSANLASSALSELGLSHLRHISSVRPVVPIEGTVRFPHFGQRVTPSMGNPLICRAASMRELPISSSRLNEKSCPLL